MTTYITSYQTLTVTTLNVTGYANYKSYIAQYHRIDSIGTTSADTWVVVTFDTLIASESTTGYDFTDDSTYFLVDFSGVVRVQGCGHWKWQGAANQNVKIFIRVRVNSSEARCLQANDTRGRQTTNDGILAYTGTIAVTSGDTIRVEYQVGSTDMDWVGDDVFDNPAAFSVNFEKISNTP